MVGQVMQLAAAEVGAEDGEEKGVAERQAGKAIGAHR
jgi:hypothetical protein